MELTALRKQKRPKTYQDTHRHFYLISITRQVDIANSVCPSVRFYQTCLLHYLFAQVILQILAFHQSHGINWYKMLFLLC